MASRAIPEIDLSHLSNYKPDVLAELKHALMNYGFFYLKNYDEMLDQNIIDLLFEQSEKLFKLPDDEKLKIHRNSSKNFLGYSAELNSFDVKIREEINFCSADHELNTSLSTYNNIVGPNQYPSQKEVPLLKNSVDQFFYSFNRFSYDIIDLIFQSLSITQDLSDYIDLQNRKTTLSETRIGHHIALDNKSKSPNQLIEASKECQFLSFLFYKSTLQVQDIYGSWIEVPPKPNTLIVNSGYLLQFLTRNMCVSNNYKIITSSMDFIGVSFSPFLKLESKLKPFEISEELLFERDQRDSIAKNNESSNSYDFKEGDVIGEKLFFKQIRKNRDIARVWYPEILNRLDQEENSSKLKMKKQSSDIEQTIKRLNKIFIALNRSVPLLVRTRTSNAKLAEVIPKIQSFTGFTVTEKELLQISYLYLDAVPLLLNEYNELLIDTDKAKDAFNYKNLSERAEFFQASAFEWLQKNKSQDDVPILSRSDIEKPTAGPSRKRLKTEVLKNPKEKYTPKPKSEKEETKKTGMSLLERIRMKDREKMKNYETPEQKYVHFLDGKLKAVLEILLALRPDTPYPLEKLSELIKNSLTKSPISEEEAKDIAIHLTKRFPDQFTSVDLKDSQVLTWKELDREELLSRLK